MNATLIEIDICVPEPRWYGRHPGLRVWARKEYGTAWDLRWHVLPGQSVHGVVDSSNLWVDLEHAWQVREGEVELRLMEIQDGHDQP